MDDLYRDYILEHYRRPHNFGVIDDPTASFEGSNPLCGDRITMQLGIENGVVERVGFTGRGCAISQASASLLTDEIKGKPVAEVAAFRADDLLDLLGIDISPARLKCAMLSHETLHKALAETDARRARPRAQPHDGRPRALLRVSPAGLAGSPFVALLSSRPAGVQPAARRPSGAPTAHATHLCRPPARGPRRRSARSPPSEVERPARRRRRPSSTSARTAEWEQGHLPGALHISKSYVEQQIEGAVPDRDAPVVLYCAGGVRSLFAAQTLEQLGYTNVASMSGGFQAWKSAGLPWEAPVVLTAEQKQRYSRHLLIPEVGSAGQARLLGSKALFIGAGGLGSPGGALSRGRRRRHDRDRRLRRRRPVQPPAPDPPHERPDRRAEGRVGPQDDQRPEPGRERSSPTRRCSSPTTSTGSSPATT